MSKEEQAVSIQIAEVAAGTDQVWDIAWPYSGTWTITKLYFMPQTNRTAHDTNYTDSSVEVTTTEIASEQTTTGDTGNLTAGTAEVLALTASGTSLEIAQGERLTLKKTDAGTGVALDGTFTAVATKLRA